MDEKKQHWENIYSTKMADQLSWTQAAPSPSLEWILELTRDRSGAVIDVGGGTSTLVDGLLDRGFARPAVLDISTSALMQAKARLGAKKSQVEWIEADVTAFVPMRKFLIWHDRAAFHFLTNRGDRENYLDALRSTLLSNGYAVIATFAPEGPGQCSGLTVMRFDEKSLAMELGSGFQIVRSAHVLHETPWGAPQAFTYCAFARI